MSEVEGVNVVSEVEGDSDRPWLPRVTLDGVKDIDPVVSKKLVDSEHVFVV